MINIPWICRQRQILVAQQCFRSVVFVPRLQFLWQWSLYFAPSGCIAVIMSITQWAMLLMHGAIRCNTLVLLAAYNVVGVRICADL